MTGVGPAELREQSRSPGMLAAVLDHLMQDESTLLVFCASDGIPPEDIAPARRALAEIAGEVGDPEISV
jgi:citrate lyase beta subunit